MSKNEYYTREELMEMTVAELREICRENDITGVSKKRKDYIIDLLLGESEDNYESNGKVPVLKSSIVSTLNQNDTYTSTISVSCGASSGNFAVVGKSVADVKSLYREIMNIDLESSAVVNGDKVRESYILKKGDVLEFLRKSGTKG